MSRSVVVLLLAIAAAFDCARAFAQPADLDLLQVERDSTVHAMPDADSATAFGVTAGTNLSGLRMPSRAASTA